MKVTITYQLVMAKPSWLTINPGSGNGNGTIQFSGTEHTGRAARTYVATVANTKTADCTVNVSQTAKDEFVTMQATASPAKTGGELTITGSSNSTKLTFSWKQSPAPTLVLKIPASYTAGGTSTPNGTAISGDPGATAQYSFSIKFTIPANTTIGQLTATLVVIDAGGHTAQCVITQAAGDAYLWVGKMESTRTDCTIPQAGTAASVQVFSNDAWTVE